MNINFNIEKLDNKIIFIHSKINSLDDFLKDFFDYFFSGFNLWKYVNYKVSIDEYDSSKNKKIYNKLLNFFDLIKNNNSNYENFFMGKIGEYIASIILINYFKYNMILPKISMTTSFNTNSFGIDLVFYNYNDMSLVLGESKLTHNLKSGIDKIKNSLINYRDLIIDEINLFYSKEEMIPEKLLPNILYNFNDLLNNDIIKKIIIPLFITHGTEIKIDDIFKQLEELKKYCSVLDFQIGVNIEYMIISLPIIDKKQLFTFLEKELKERCEEWKKL